MIVRIACSGVLVGIFTALPLLAQTAPCGRTLLLANDEGGSASEARFIPAPPEHVEASLLRALPAVGAVVKERNGLVLHAKTDGSQGGFTPGLWGAWYAVNKQAGIKGQMAGTTRGEWTIELRPETRDGVTGTNVTIGFEKPWRNNYGAGKFAATPLMNEIECLSGLLSVGDPLASPRGPVTTDPPTDARTVTLAEGTPLKVILRDPCFSKDMAKTAGQAQLVFEVAADVNVGEVTVVRKGALGVGRFTEVKAASGGGKGGTMQFAIEHVTAVDGQSVSVVGAAEGGKGKGVPTPTVANAGLVGFAIGGMVGHFQKGYDTLVRAGTTFDVEVSGTHAIRAAR